MKTTIIIADSTVKPMRTILRCSIWQTGHLEHRTKIPPSVSISPPVIPWLSLMPAVTSSRGVQLLTK